MTSPECPVCGKSHWSWEDHILPDAEVIDSSGLPETAEVNLPQDGDTPEIREAGEIIIEPGKDVDERTPCPTCGQLPPKRRTEYMRDYMRKWRRK